MPLSVHLSVDQAVVSAAFAPAIPQPTQLPLSILTLRPFAQKYDKTISTIVVLALPLFLTPMASYPFWGVAARCSQCESTSREGPAANRENSAELYPVSGLLVVRWSKRLASLLAGGITQASRQPPGPMVGGLSF
jgi:arginase family enzyme